MHSGNKQNDFFSVKKNCLVTVPSLTNLGFTLEEFIKLSEKLLYEEGFNYILTRALNQDPLENFFSAIRSHGVRHVSPDVTHFETSFKALLINNFLTAHSPNANCNAYFSVGALSNLKEFLKRQPHQDDVNAVELTNISIPQVHKQSKIAKCTLVYITGYRKF